MPVNNISEAIYISGAIIALLGLVLVDFTSKERLGCLLWVLGLITFSVGLSTTFLVIESTEYSSTFYDIYTVTFPYGFFSVSGELHGSMSLLGGSINGYIEGAEYYSVKYYVGEYTIYTKVLSATSTPLILDGTYQLEAIQVKQIITNQVFGDKHVKSTSYIYKIHVPDQLNNGGVN